MLIEGNQKLCSLLKLGAVPADFVLVVLLYWGEIEQGAASINLKYLCRARVRRQTK